MLKRRRFFSLAALLMSLAMVAAACSGDTEPTTAAPSDTPTTTAAAPTETTAAPTETTAAPTDTTAAAPDLAGTSVSIFGSETADEEQAFNEALAPFIERTGINVTFTGAGDFSDQINAQAEAGNPPDIAIFPQPGKLADFARDGLLLPLPTDVDTATKTNWSEAWTSFGNVDGTQFGIPVKTDLKSLVWYQPAAFTAAGYTVPETWDDLKALSDQMIADGNTPWCVGIFSDAATGWPFTDWVEDLTLRIEGADFYDQWVNHEVPFNNPQTEAIFNEILDLWNKPGATFAAEGTIAATNFRANGTPLVEGNCFMHRQASFFAAFFPEGTPFADGSDGAVDVFYFPSVKGDRPVLGAGTLASAFRDAPEVWAVMEYLSSPEYAENRQRAQAEIKQGLSGFLSAALGQDLSVYSDLEQSFLEILQNAEVVRFDGSDLMPAAVGAGTFWTEATSAVNGDLTVKEAIDAIEASWP